MDLTKSPETSTFSKSVTRGTSDLRKHLYRQKYMLILSYIVKCIFPLGKTHFKSFNHVQMRFIETVASDVYLWKQFPQELKFMLFSLIPIPFF